MRAASRTSCSSPAAPSAICRGNVVAPKIRKPAPVSKSALFSNGTDAAACSRFSTNATANGWPSVAVPYVEFRSTGGAGSLAPKT